MKRLFILLAGMLAVLTVLAATAGATPAKYDLTLTATPPPPALAVGDSTDLAGMLTADQGGVANKNILIQAYDGGTCAVDPSDAITVETGIDGAFGATAGPFDHAGTYSFDATMLVGQAVAASSDCVTVVVNPVDTGGNGDTGGNTPATTPTAPYEFASSYLCWNQEMVDPVAYLDPVADTMWKTGNYFEPQAILGNVLGGTNIGAYHLVCNQPKLTPTGFALGGSGEVYTAPMVSAYHSEHAPVTNDLNIYHIYS